MTTPITPKIFQMVPTINQNMYEFADEITKLSQVLKKEYSTRPEDYSELQIALLLRDRAKICRLINDDVPVGEVHKETISTCLLAVYTDFITEDEKNFAFLFARTSPPDRAAVLFTFLASHQDAYFEMYWQVACPSSKALTLGCPINLDSKFVDQLFIKESPKIQSETLTIALQTNNESSFCRLWKKADPSVQGLQPSIKHSSNEDKEKPLIFMAIFFERASILSFLLQNGISLQVFNGNETALEMALKHRNALGEPLITQIAQRDAGFTYEIEILTLFGHAFDLKGEVFEGIMPHKTSMIPHLIASFLERQRSVFCNYTSTSTYAEDPLFSPDILETMRFSLRGPEELIERAKEKWTLVRCGWKRHAVACIFSKDYCIKINTGSSNSRWKIL